MKSEFIQSFIRNANLHPEKTAVVDNAGDRRTTYGELYLLAAVSLHICVPCRSPQAPSFP